MKKLKEIWAKNKVMIVLILILFICFIAILVVCFTFFLGGSKSVYGDRLKDIENHPITENFKSEFESSLETDDLIEDVKIKTSGRVIYVRMKFVKDTVLLEAKGKAMLSLDKFNDDILDYYDINYTLVCDPSENSEGFTIMGAKNVSSKYKKDDNKETNPYDIVWNNNTKVESEDNT